MEVGGSVLTGHEQGGSPGSMVPVFEQGGRLGGDLSVIPTTTGSEKAPTWGKSAGMTFRLTHVSQLRYMFCTVVDT